MADEKSKNLTGADGPDKDPAQPEAGGSKATKHAFASFPEPVYWPRLADVLNQEGLTTDVQADHIAVSW